MLYIYMLLVLVCMFRMSVVCHVSVSYAPSVCACVECVRVCHSMCMCLSVCARAPDRLISTSMRACVRVCTRVARVINYVNKLFGVVWICLDLFGVVWCCLELFGVGWGCLGLFGVVWGCLGRKRERECVCV